MNDFFSPDDFVTERQKPDDTMTAKFYCIRSFNNFLTYIFEELTHFSLIRLSILEFAIQSQDSKISTHNNANKKMCVKIKLKLTHREKQNSTLFTFLMTVSEINLRPCVTHSSKEICSDILK